jgi:hypothetical protein
MNSLLFGTLKSNKYRTGSEESGHQNLPTPATPGHGAATYNLMRPELPSVALHDKGDALFLRSNYEPECGSDC